MQEVLRLHGKLIFLFKEEVSDDNAFDNTRGQRADGSAANAHFRCAEAACDQNKVDGYVDYKRYYRYAQRDLDGFGNAHGAQHDG